MIVKKILIVPLLWILLPVVLASVNCNPNSLTANFTQGSQPPTKTILCSNSGNESVSFAEDSPYISLSDSAIGASPSSKTITVSYDPNTPIGNHFSSITFSDNSPQVSLFLTVHSQPVVTQSCRLIVFPTSYRKSLQNGETGSKTIEVQVSKFCKSPLNIHLLPSEDTEKPINFEDVSGDINPGEKFLITLLFDARGVQNGDYSKQIRIQGIDDDEEMYESLLTISAKVSGTISPLGSGNFSIPSCTVAEDMTLNTTYDLVCNNIDPNFDPLLEYSDFFEGIRADETTNSITYTLKPRIVGNTKIRVLFLYKGLNIGTPFEKEIRITSAGVVIPGTIAKFIFFPKIEELQGEGEVRVLLVDNKTESVIQGFKLLIDGAETENNTVLLRYGKEYELRGVALSYPDTTERVKLKTLSLSLILDPEKTEYLVGEKIKISSNYNGTAFFLDGAVTSPEFSVYVPGSHIIKVVKEGFIPAERNITFIEKITYSSSPIKEEWKIGKKITIVLSANSSWAVESGGQTITSGVGSQIQFTPQNIGTYTLKANGQTLDAVLIDKKGFWKGWMTYTVIGAILLIAGIYIYRKKEEDIGYAPVINTK